MAFEYLCVLYPTRRRVKINGAFNGYINEVIELEGGSYEVSLGPPPNFDPPSATEAVDTSPPH